MGTWWPARTCTSASCSMRSTRRSLGRLDALWTRARFAMQPDRRPTAVPATGTRVAPTPTGSQTSTKKAAGLQRLWGAGATGLEPATSGVTGRRSNQLSYAPVGGHSMAPGPGQRRGARRWPATTRRRDRNRPRWRVFAGGVNRTARGRPRAQVYEAPSHRSRPQRGPRRTGARATAGPLARPAEDRRKGNRRAARACIPRARGMSAGMYIGIGTLIIVLLLLIIFVF